MRLSEQETKQIEEAMDIVGLGWSDTVEDYTGRGESKPCFGITFDFDHQAEEFFVQLAILNSDLAQALVSSARHDMLGKNPLVYFPGYELC